MSEPPPRYRRFLSALAEAFRVVILDDLTSGLLDLKSRPTAERWLGRIGLLILGGIVACSVYYSLERTELGRNWIDLSLVQAQSKHGKEPAGAGLSHLSLSFAGPIGLPPQALYLCVCAITLAWGLTLAGARRAPPRVYFPLLALLGANLWFFASLVGTLAYVGLALALSICSIFYYFGRSWLRGSVLHWSAIYSAIIGLFFAASALVGGKFVLSAGLVASQVILLFLLTGYWLILGIDTIDAGARVGRWLAGLVTYGPMLEKSRYLIAAFLLAKVLCTFLLAPSLLTDAVITLLLLIRLIFILVRKEFRRDTAVVLTSLTVLSTVIVYYADLSLSGSGLISAALFIIPPVVFFAFFTAYDFLGKGAAFANDDTPQLPRSSRLPIILGFAILASTTMLFFFAARDDAFEAFSSQISTQAVLVSGIPFALHLLINRLPELIHIGAQVHEETEERVPRYVFALLGVAIAIGLSASSGLLTAQFAKAAMLTNRADIIAKDRPDEALALYQGALKAFPAYYKGHFNLGVFHQLQKRPEAAADEFKAAIAANSEYIPAYINLGVALTSLKRDKEAEEVYYKAISLDRKLSYAYNNLAVLANGRGAWAEGEKLARQAIATATQDRFEFYDTLGQALFEVGKWKEAETSLQKAVSLKPEAAATYNTMGVFYTAWGTRAVLNGEPKESGPRYQKARQAYEAAQKRGADAFLIGTNLSQLYLDLGQLDKAESLVKQTIVSFPKDANLKHILGLILLRAKRRTEARAAFAAAKAVDESYPYAWAGEALMDLEDGSYARCAKGNEEALKRNLDRDYVRFNLAVCYTELGRPKDALAQIDAVLAKQPSAEAFLRKSRVYYEYGKDAEAEALWKRGESGATARDYFVRGTILAKRGNLRGAEADFRKAIALDPDYDSAHSELGLALEDQGRRDEAIAEYKKAIELDPQRAEAYVNLGSSLGSKGDLAAAEAMYRKAIALDPQLIEPRYGLSQILARTGKLAEALSTAQSALASAPSPASPKVPKSGMYARISLLAGQIEYGAKNYPVAETYLKDAIAYNPGWPDSYVYLGLSTSAHGDVDTARAAFEKAITLIPDPSRRALIEGALKALKKRKKK